MTEIERIINEGIIPETFFVEEVRNEFFVDKERKKLWAILIDLLLQIDKICNKYNLSYFLVGGSLLGAVRHNGFIPWDDDIDIALPRKDYDILLQHQNEFEKPYFFQTPYNDKGYYYTHAKLRNSNTSAIDEPFKYQGFNMGMFIDILPLDLISDIGGREKFDLIKKLTVLNSTAMRMSNPNLPEKDKKRVKEYPGGDPIERNAIIQELITSDRNSNAKNVSLLTGVVYGYDKDVFPKECFESSIDCLFEGYYFPIPAGYDAILKIAYGDYNTFPPIDKRGAWHGNVSFNTDVSYIDLLKQQLSK